MPYRYGEVERPAPERKAPVLDLVPGLMALRPVRQNFVRVAPSPFVIDDLLRGPKFSLGQNSIGIPGTSPGGPGEPEVDPCLGLNGGVFSTADTVGAGATTVVVTPVFPFPFIISHIQGWSNSAATGLRVQLKVSPEDSGGTSLAVLGTPVLGPPGFAGAIDVFNEPSDFYPNFVVAVPNQFVKMFLVNTTGGAIAISLRGSWKRL